ncbi:LysR family transcriptional regulator [Comamonas humi]
MELRQLEAFAAVMSTGSVTAAGRLLGRSQPAVSRLVQELEAEIGYELFARNGPRVTPTEQGFLLYEDVEHALTGLQQIRRRAKEIEQGLRRPLRVVATTALAAGLVPQALARIEGAEAAGAIQLRSAAPERVVHDVLSGAAHLGVTSLPLEHRGLQVHWIGQAACVAVLPESDPLAQLDRVPLAALAERQIVTMANPYRLRHRLDAAFAEAQAGGDGAERPMPRLIETNSSLNAMMMVRAGLGVAVLEPVTAHGVPLPGVAVRALDTDIPFLFGAVTRQAAPFQPAMDALMAALAEAAAALLPGFVLHDAASHGALLQQAAQEAEPAAMDTTDTDNHP